MRKYYVPMIYLQPHKYNELVKYGYLRTTDYYYEVVELSDGVLPLQAKRVSRFTYDKAEEIVNVSYKGCLE